VEQSGHVGSVTDENTPGNSGIDFMALATALRKQGKNTQAELVEFMADKEEATAEEIAQHVHDQSEMSNSAIWNNAKRTTDSLAQLGSRLSFRFVSSRMYREISPK
jgi:hypothetical protein